MISYFERSKAHVTISEDSLTSMVFDHLKYLPAEIFLRILRRSLYEDKLPLDQGEFIEMLFWDRWNVKENIRNSNKRYVEPDVFIRYENVDLLIEAKRYNERQQSDYQLHEQINGYFYNFGGEGKQLFYIQMGGLFNKSDSSDYLFEPDLKVNEEGEVIKNEKVPILKSDWNTLLNSVVFEINLLDDIPYSHFSCFRRLLQDLIQGFELFQFYRLKWLRDMKARKSEISIFNTSFDYVRR